MKILKKIFVGLLVFGAVSFAFAQEKENLDDYLDEINSLIQEGIALSAQYRAQYDAAITQLQTAAQEKINAVSAQEALPWETPYEHSKRINDEVLEIQAQLKTDMEEKSAELNSTYKSQKNALAEKKSQKWAEIEQKQFHCAGANVQISIGAFEPYEKCWPILVKTVDSQLFYNSGELKFFVDVENVTTEYYRIQDIIDGANVKGEVNVRVQQKNPDANTYEICLIDVVLYGAEDEVLCKFPGYSQVIQTVDYTKEIYDPNAQLEVSQNEQGSDAATETEEVETGAQESSAVGEDSLPTEE